MVLPLHVWEGNIPSNSAYSHLYCCQYLRSASSGQLPCKSQPERKPPLKPTLACRELS